MEVQWSFKLVLVHAKIYNTVRYCTGSRLWDIVQGQDEN